MNFPRKLNATRLQLFCSLSYNFWNVQNCWNFVRFLCFALLLNCIQIYVKVANVWRISCQSWVLPAHVCILWTNTHRKFDFANAFISFKWKWICSFKIFSKNSIKSQNKLCFQSKTILLVLLAQNQSWIAIHRSLQKVFIENNSLEKKVLHPYPFIFVNH